MEKEITFKQYKTALKIVKDFQCQVSNLNSDFKDSINKLKKLNFYNENVTPGTTIRNAGLSVRACNCLIDINKSSMSMTVRELSKIPISKLWKAKNFGNKSMEEIVDLINNVGLSYIN